MSNGTYTAIAESITHALEKVQEAKKAIEAIPITRPNYSGVLHREIPSHALYLDYLSIESDLGPVIDKLRVIQALRLPDAIAADGNMVDAEVEKKRIK